MENEKGNNEKEDKNVSVPGSLDKPLATISQDVLDELVRRSELAELKKEAAAVSTPKPHRTANTQARLVRGVH